MSAFSPHGIDLTVRDDGDVALLVVNHGERESVEFFAVAANGDLTWRGCALPPEDPFINDVAARHDGGFYVTYMWDKSADFAATAGALQAGKSTGWVWAWSPSDGFSKLAATNAQMPNGVAIKADNATLFVNVYFGGGAFALDLASEQLHKTQPAISQGLKQLEQKLGVELLDRDDYRLKSTRQGHVIYQQSLRVLAEISRVEQISENFARGEESIITIAIDAACDHRPLLPLLKALQRLYPQTQVSLQNDYITGAHAAIVRGDADIGISPAFSALSDDQQIESKFLLRNNLICVASPEMAQRLPHPLTQQALLDETQIVIRDSNAGADPAVFGVQASQRQWFVNDFQVKRALILNGLGWGRMPEHFVHQDLTSCKLVNLDIHELKRDSMLAFYAIKRRNRLLGPVAQHAWAQLTEWGATPKTGIEVL